MSKRRKKLPKKKFQKMTLKKRILEMSGVLYMIYGLCGIAGRPAERRKKSDGVFAAFFGGRDGA